MKNANKISYLSILILSAACGQTIEREDTQTDQSQWNEIYSKLELNDDNVDTDLSNESEEITEELQQDGQSEAFESENLEALRVIREDLRAQRHEICGIDSTLSTSIRDQIKAIRSDENLSKEERKAEAREIIEANKDALKSQKEAFKVCREEQGESLSLIRNVEENFSEVCFAGKKLKHKKGFMAKKGKRSSSDMKALRVKFSGKSKNQKPHQSREEVRSMIEQSIDSDECTQAINDYQSNQSTTES